MKLEPVYIANIGSVDCTEKAIKVTYVIAPLNSPINLILEIYITVGNV